MQIHLKDEGEGIPIVLLHGTSASLHTWDGWAEALKKDHRVIRYDMPGFGLTGPSPDNDYTIETYARVLIAVLDRLGVDQCVLAGNSLGGRVAWSAALLYGDRISRLVLIDASGYPFRPESVPIGFQIARIPLLNRLLGNVLPRGMVESSLKNVYGDPDLVTPDLVDRYFELTTRAGNREALVHRFQQLQPGPLTLKFPNSRCPRSSSGEGRTASSPRTWAGGSTKKFRAAG